jgi:magnesium transporter
MPRFIKKLSQKAGKSPGTLVHIGEPRVQAARLSISEYDAQDLLETTGADLQGCLQRRLIDGRIWINMDGVHDLDTIQTLGDHFHLHPLTLEDIVNTAQRPKLEAFDGYLYLVIKMLHYDEAQQLIVSEQLSLVWGKSFLLSFQEATGDVFNPVRERLRKGRGRIRASGGDYLAYALVDAIVDHYFTVLEQIGDKIEALEETLIEQAVDINLEVIHALKKDMIYLRRQVWPLREVVASLERGEFDLVDGETRLFLRDVYDHTIQVIETIESYRDLLTGMMDLYLTSISNRMNEVMKVLTIIATIFIPITFIAGVYGMNFKFIPELQWRWGYLAFWGISGVIAAIMLWYFRRKKWF